MTAPGSWWPPLAWEVENAAGAIAAITAAFDRFGVPALVLADNGSAFTCRTRSPSISRFTRVVTAAGARLIHSSPYHPQTCGKVERHHRTFKAWLLAQPAPPATLAELQTVCDRYQAWYNTRRRHSAWNKPPQQAWDDAPALGGPTELPIQCDAQIKILTVFSQRRHQTHRPNRGLSRPSPRRHPSHGAPRRRPRHHLQPQRQPPSAISTSTGPKPDNNSAQRPNLCPTTT